MRKREDAEHDPVLRGKVMGIRIHTPECQEVQSRFAHWYLATLSGIPVSALVDGESGTGKSVVLHMLHRGLISKRTPDGLQQRGALIPVPSKPTPIGFLESVLRAIGDPRPEQGTRTTKMARLVKNIREQRLLFLFFDDLQHIVDKNSGLVIYDTSECLKELVDQVCCSVICAGLPEARKVVEANEQLKRRYCGPLHMQRYNWKDPASCITFLGILKGFREALPEFDMPLLESEEMGERFYLATGGILDFVAKTIMWATWQALDDNRRVIRLADFAKGWPKALFEAERLALNPFQGKLPSGEARDAALTSASQLNAPVKRPRGRVRLADIGM